MAAAAGRASANIRKVRAPPKTVPQSGNRPLSALESLYSQRSYQGAIAAGEAATSGDKSFYVMLGDAYYDTRR